MSSTFDNGVLAQPLRIGQLNIQHRVALAPLTRFRANKAHVHGDLAVEYYEQRSSVPGTLLVSEGTFIGPQAGGFENVPGIWNDAQVQSWKKVTDAVHAKGSFIYCQLWALGRAAERSSLPAEYDIISSGDIALPDRQPPRPLTETQIDDWVNLYAQAARNAIAAGFDGVELHNANGYLLDQFLQTTCNNRTDAYGGVAGNRIRFTLRAVDGVVRAIGANRTGIRLSPYERYNGMGMPTNGLLETFSLVIRSLAPLGLAYLHLTEPRVSGQLQARADSGFGVSESLNWAAALWFGRSGSETEIASQLGVSSLPAVAGSPAPTNVLILAGGYTSDSAQTRLREADSHGDRLVIAFGRWFISNPDLPTRLIRGIPLTPYDRSTFYKRESPDGYTTYPFAKHVKNDEVPKASL